jgi:hypothetical protein
MLPANDLVGDALVFYGRCWHAQPEATRAAQEGLDPRRPSQWWRVRCGSLSHAWPSAWGWRRRSGQPRGGAARRADRGLDPKSAFYLREYIREQRKAGHTIVISTTT